MGQDKIVIHGARVNNLKNVNVEIPRDKLVLMTGLSGSGKSSLAFDTIYAEGQRRYMESLSSYARQFLGQMEKPDVDEISGLSPAISIDQKTTSKNPRSTVGTVTEIYDYLRLLYARIGVPYCPECGKVISNQSVDQIVDQLLALPEGSRLQILSPVVRNRKGEYKKVFQTLSKSGFVRARVDGEMRDLSEDIQLEKNRKHNIEVVIDRIKVRPDIAGRLADSIQAGLAEADGEVWVDVNGEEMLTFSEHLACAECGISIPELTPQLFSFNNPLGACPVCLGIGNKMEIDPNLVIPDPTLSLKNGAVAPWQRGSISNYYEQNMLAAAAYKNIDISAPWKDLSEKEQEFILYGGDHPKITFTYTNLFKEKRTYTKAFEGVLPNLERRHRESSSDHAREDAEQYMRVRTCPACHGRRLRPEALAVLVGEKNISEVTELTIAESENYFEELILTERQALIARLVLKEIKARLAFLNKVGLTYLTLSRAAGTLSGGEAQRIRLATQIGSGLVGVLYILDEPSIGLHQRDNARLIESLQNLRDLGNTLIVVEHDEDTIRAADFIVDVGPGAGEHGGEIVVAGDLETVENDPNSITGRYLSGRESIPLPAQRRPVDPERYLRVVGARENNLKDVTVDIPLGLFTCVTGVSGSGKSTLVNEILYKSLAKSVYPNSKAIPGAHDRIEGLALVDKVVDIDQSPIGRTPRSNPATYTGAFDAIRSLFSQTKGALIHGYKPGRFSFNVKGGRCETCKGDGITRIEMHFLPDVYVPCEVCKGKRYNRETLEVTYKDKNIADVLDMIVDEAVDFFANIPRVYNKIKTLQEVGLGYIRLGQPATTLSGGEAQRIKLATELSKRPTGKTMYILDEPTTGLHSDDIRKLLAVLMRLTSGGDSVLVIEHNLDVIKSADYLIDLGPEGGSGGGTVVATGTPETIAAVAASHTGQYLKKLL